MPAKAETTRGFPPGLSDLFYNNRPTSVSVHKDPDPKDMEDTRAAYKPLGSGLGVTTDAAQMDY